MVTRSFCFLLSAVRGNLLGCVQQTITEPLNFFMYIRSHSSLFWLLSLRVLCYFEEESARFVHLRNHVQSLVYALGKEN